jgi:hypothetical protein
MNIPTYVRRRVVEIDNYLTQRLTLYPQYFTSQRKDGYLNRMTRDLSEWFIQTYDFHYGMPTDYYKKVNDLIPVIKYLYRTKIILHWEKMNGWGQ